MEALQVVASVAAIALPFVLYILHGIRHALHDLRNQLQPVITAQAVARTELDIIKKQLKLMDESA